MKLHLKAASAFEMQLKKAHESDVPLLSARKLFLANLFI